MRASVPIPIELGQVAPEHNEVKSFEPVGRAAVRGDSIERTVDFRIDTGRPEARPFPGLCDAPRGRLRGGANRRPRGYRHFHASSLAVVRPEHGAPWSRRHDLARSNHDDVHGTAAPGSEHRLERDLVYSFDPQRSFDGLRPRMEAPLGAGRYSPLRPEYDILGSERGEHWTERDPRRVFVLSGGDMRPRMYRAWPRTESGWPRCGRRRPRNLEDDVRGAQCDRDLRSGS